MDAHGLVDLHCHLDLFPDHESLIDECEDAGVFTLTVTTTPRAWPRNQELTAKKRYVRAALGLHPQLIAEHSHELELWKSYLPQARYVGEVGLDAGPKFYRSIEDQKRVFIEILRACAEAGDKVLTVHSVRAAKAVLDHVEEHLPPARGKVVLHWFTGSGADVKRAVELGCYFSVNEAMVNSPNGAKLLTTIPLERVLTETDGPFTQVQGRPARPIDVRRLLPRLSQAYAISETELAATIKRTLRSLLGNSSTLG